MNVPEFYRPDVIAVAALATLEDWSSMAQEAFSANTIRAWRADWESRGVTGSDLRAGVNPSLGPAEKTSCFLRRGDHPRSLHSTRSTRDDRQCVAIGTMGIK